MAQQEQTEAQNIIKALSSPDLNVRLAAVKELAAAKIPQKFQILEKLLLKDRHPSIQNEIKRQLAQADLFAGNQELLKKLNPEMQRVFRALQSEDEKLVHRAFVYLVKNNQTELLNIMFECENRFPDPFFRFCNLKLICRLKNRLALLPRYLHDTETEVVHKTIEILAHDASPKAIYILLDNAGKLKALAVKKIWKSLEKIASEKIKPVLRKMTESEFPAHRLIVTEALNQLQPPYSVELLNTLTGDENPEVSDSAWMLVEKMAAQGLPEALALMQKIGTKAGAQNLLREKRRAYHQDKTNFLALLKQLQENPAPKELSIIIQKIGFCEVEAAPKINILLNYLHHQDNRVRADCIEALSCCRLSPNEFAKLHEMLPTETNNRVIGNIILTLSEKKDIADQYQASINTSIRKLCQSAKKNFQLTGIFCIEHLLEDKYAEMLFYLANAEDRQIRDRALQTLENWALSSIAIKSELDRRKINGLLRQSDQNEDLDEFID